MGSSHSTEPLDAAESTPAKDPLRRSRTSGAWLAVVAFALLLLALAIFIAQNTQRAEISFLGWQGELPLSAALLLAAVIGTLLAVVAGGLRMIQVRHRVRRSR